MISKKKKKKKKHNKTRSNPIKYNITCILKDSSEIDWRLLGADVFHSFTSYPKN